MPANPDRDAARRRGFPERLSAALIDTGTALDAACRIIILEDQLEEALRFNAELRKDT